jgi:hypothetical protein
MPFSVWLQACALIVPPGITIHMFSCRFHTVVRYQRTFRAIAIMLLAVWLVNTTFIVRGIVMEACAHPIDGKLVPIACSGPHVP